MKVYEIERKTDETILVETEENNELLFDSQISTFGQYKRIKDEEVKRIEIDTDGGRRFLILFV